LKLKKFLYKESKRLVVRPLAAADFAEWKLTHSSMLPAKNKWDRVNKDPADLSKQKFTALLKSQKRLRDLDQFYDLAVFEKSTGKLVGTVSVMDVLRGIGQSAYLGYAIFNPFWGRGFGKEAVLAMIAIGFEQIKVHRLEAGIEPSNRRSILLAKSVGLRKEGFKKRAVLLRGKWIDLSVYAATCEDFGISWKGNTKSRMR
jgi:ribosomal-protein-alanine N-acetyltransferase